jgi:hypothetical protein
MFVETVGGVGVSSISVNIVKIWRAKLKSKASKNCAKNGKL